MNQQWKLLLALLFALLIAIFAVLNVDSVRLSYGFGIVHLPLVVVILSSVFAGGLIVSLFSFVKIVSLQRQLKKQTARADDLEMSEKDEQQALADNVSVEEKQTKQTEV